MTETQLGLGNENRSMKRALEELKHTLSSATDVPHSLRYGFHKEYLLTVLYQGINEEINTLDAEFETL
jgi:hypothetical protein